MAKKSVRQDTPETTGDPIPLPDPKKYLKLFYAGSQLASPMGGFLEPLRVRKEDDGSATAVFECSSSSLRFQLPIPKATRTERTRVREQQKEGIDPWCPRHGPSQRLGRAGNELVCPVCEVTYGKV